MILKIVQTGDPILRKTAALNAARDQESSIQQLIESMRGDNARCAGRWSGGATDRRVSATGGVEDRTEYIKDVCRST